MSGMSVTALLNQLAQLEDAARGDPHLLAKADATYASLADKAPLAQVLAARNRFRIRHAGHLPRTRPRILIGAMNDGGFPNFHTIPLLKLADVVSLTSTPGPTQIERVQCQPLLDTIEDVCARLPPGFQPDFFFDNFIDAHWLPLGLERAPFPTVGGIVHHYRSHLIAAMAPLFDYLLPLSPGFGEGLKAMGAPGQILDLPIGANWGSFHHMLTPNGPKTVDLAVTFGPGSIGVNLGYRHFLYRTMRRIADAHPGRFNIVFAEGLKKPDFIALLQRSRIVVNAPGLHGPWNYRISEAAAVGAMVIHLQYPAPVSWDIGPYLADGEEIAIATPETLEEVTLRYLKDSARAEQIGRNGHEAMKTRYSYEAIYRLLIDRVMGDIAAGRATASGKPDGMAARRTLGRAYFECDLPELQPLTLIGLAASDGLPRPHRANDSAAIVHALGSFADKPGVLTAFAPDLARPHETAASFVARQLKAAGSGPVASYNRALLAMLSGDAGAEALARTALAALDASPDHPQYADWLILARTRPPHLDASEWDEAVLKFWEGRHLAAKGASRIETQAKRNFMLWQMHRFLAAAAENPEVRDLHLDQALTLFPDNASLHLIAARGAATADAALKHVNAALAAYPLMDAAVAMRDELLSRTARAA
jgi:hypothetical protein